MVIGQGENGGCLVWDRGQMRYLIAESAGVCRFIRAVRDGDDVSVAYWGQSGVPSAAHWLTVAEMRALPLVGSTPTPEPPIPVPPTPEPPMTQYPPAAWSIIEQVHSRFAAGLPGNEDGARTFTEMCNQQLAYSFPSEGWCWKASSPTNPPSKDVTARQYQGRFEGWDILDAASVNGPKYLADPPGYHDLQGQWPIPVTPINHLGITPPVPVPPTPEPPQPPIPPVPGEPTLAAIWAAVQRIEANQNRVFR